MGKEKQSCVCVGEEESVSPVLWLISSLLHMAFPPFPIHLCYARFEVSLPLLSVALSGIGCGSGGVS